MTNTINKKTKNIFKDYKIKLMFAVLSNDEVSTDNELVSYFMQELRITKLEAKKIVSNRDYYLNNFI